MKNHAALAGDARTRFDRLNSAGLIIGVHDADEDGAWRDGGAKLIRVEPAGGVDGKAG